MQKLSLIILITIFAVSCKYDGSKDLFNAGVKKMEASTDSVKQQINYKDALNDFNKAIEINPGYVNAYLNRAVVKNTLGDYNGFLQDCKKVSELDAQNKDLYVLLGRIKYFRHDYNGAIAALNMAITVDAKSAVPFFIKAQIEKDQKNNQAALKDFDQTINLTSSNDESLKYYYSGRGSLKLDLNDKNGACADFHKALELGNNNAQFEIDSFCK